MTTPDPPDGTSDPRDLLALLDALDIAEQGRQVGCSLPVECCASGRCEVCTPGFKWGA